MYSVPIFRLSLPVALASRRAGYRLRNLEMERRAGIEPASLAWKARVIASIRTPRLLAFDINELGQNAKDILGML